MIIKNTHQLVEAVGIKNPSAFQIKFNDGEIYLLKNLRPIDSTIYNQSGLWTSEIVKIISVNQKKRKLLKEGDGLDFKESDIEKIGRIECGPPTHAADDQ